MSQEVWVLGLVVSALSLILNWALREIRKCREDIREITAIQTVALTDPARAAKLLAEFERKVR